MLHLHRAERADRLVEALAGVVAEPLDDPFAPETVSVPTRGVERWLTQRLSTALGTSAGRSDGVCANVDFPFPGRLVGGALAVACGVERDVDPWLPQRAVWPLLGVVDDCLDDDWLAPLAAHLGGAAPDPEHRTARRFAALRHLADLFDRYGVHRPAMLRAWTAGHDTDHDGAPLPPDVAWQAPLWRRLRDRLGTPSPAERLPDACARLRDQPGLLDLPARLSLFGLTRLPASYLDVLRALAAGRDVHLFLLHPSPALWQRITDTTPAHPRPVRRRDDPTAAMPRNPLLATWGQDAREMQLVLTAGDGGHAEHHHRIGQRPRTLLERLQADVRADRLPPGPPLPGHGDARAVLDPGDASVQVHACHGRARQVEVVRDAILHLLAADPTLEPRDVVVMCPDIDAFAPLIHATFGAGAQTDDDHGDLDDAGPVDPGLPDLRVRLADRSIRQTNPVLGVVAELLSLAAARLTASQVVDLASREPVRRRFRFDDADLARLEQWVAAAGIRWGLDAAQRAPFELDTLDANSWRAGLDRILLGVAMSEEDLRLLGGVLPLDDVDSGDIDLAGRVAELVDRLQAAVTSLADPKPVAAWAGAIAEAADQLTATAEPEAWQRAGLQRLLEEVVAEATAEHTPCAAPLALAEVQALLADRLRGRPTRASFRTGHLTMCTLVPMRSVPHRVVCLLGLDDGLFPRRTAPDGDDVIARDPCVGDRDHRSEDRQLLLDAVLAATDRLVITYTGRDERTNAVRPPAVPLGELLDVVDRTVHSGELADDSTPVPARERVVVHHPLQPFDARNFTAGALVRDRPWSFDAVALGGARAAGAARSAPAAFLDQPLPPVSGDVVELDDLVRFVQHPVRAFLRQRLGIGLRHGDDEPADALPVELDALEQWRIGQRLLEARMSGAHPAACRAAEVARGSLPPGALGAPLLDGIAAVVERIVAEAVAQVDAGATAGTVEVTVDLGAGRLLVGTVTGVVGDRLRAVTFSRVAARQRLAAWVWLLALSAGHPGRAFDAVTVGRGAGPSVTLARIRALADDPHGRAWAALQQLRVLVDLHDRGMREPLPLYCRTSGAYAQARAAGRGGEPAARRAWESEHGNQGEDREPEHQLVLGGVVSLDDLLAAPPRDDERGEGWEADEPTRFGRQARRLWTGLLACERVSR
ncbi:MAG TPA: exodeoxyribonuclease V subunit gamma [Egibacteraceae bacterium]|nr:exodeoxyribonuclease V subunit gamma [Egibacteraceae bacterium]